MVRLSAWELLGCLLSYSALVVTTNKDPTLPMAECVAGDAKSSDTLTRNSIAFDCQLAAFGAYLPSATNDMRVVLAPDSMLACSPLTTSALSSKYNDALVVTRRGDCSFQEKLGFVVAAGASSMLLVNSEESHILLSSLEYERSAAVVVSVTRSDGERLIDLVKGKERQNSEQKDASGHITVKITPAVGLVSQMRARLEFFHRINSPVVTYETYIDIAEQLGPHVGTIEQLLGKIESISDSFDIVPHNFEDGLSPKMLEDLFSWSAVQLTKWEFASGAALHASVAAAVLRIQAFNTASKTSDLDVYKPLLSAACKLTEAGYYSHSAVLLEIALASSEYQAGNTVQCHWAFMKFLQGDVVGSLTEGRACVASTLNGSMQNVQVAKDAFIRLVRLKKSDRDRECLQQAAGLSGLLNDTELEVSCCYQAESPSSPSSHFSSPFTEELFHSMVMMGVFLDELGAFEESLRCFKYAARICVSDRTTLEIRQLLAVPVVFSSQEDMDMFLEKLTRNLNTFIETLERKKELHEREVSPLGGVGKPSSAKSGSVIPTLRPEVAAYLQYTITPPTMFIGYQGIDVLTIQRAVNKLRSSAYPSLSTSFVPHDPVGLDTNSLENSHKLRRVGFISTWFRAHSVGKLLLGVIENLDRSKFHVSIYRCVHFLRDSDKVTKAFKDTADEYVELPENQDRAVQLLRGDQLDVVVYPELGMDEWTVLLSHHRVAPVQCVFWGHPITTGNPHIDYFISSEHFVSEYFDDPANGSRNEDGHHIQLSGYRRSAFSEQIVLFRGLSTIFTKPVPITAESKDISRLRLHLPTNRRLYLCPQTLMKLHPAFDEALAGILDRDEKAAIVLLASDSQAVWMEQLRRRFRKRFGRNYRRVLFLRTLPFEEFQALLGLADVVLDPFPFGGGVTTLDSLHLGIPVITFPAAQSVVHLAAGFLRYMNASDCIAESLEEYVALAVTIAADSKHIRSRLLEHRSSIYQDDSTVEDWNEFLSIVGPREHNASPS